MSNLTESIVTIAVAIIGLATLAVLVSRQATTVDIIGTGGNAFSQALRTAISPVTGGGGGGFGGGFGGGGGFGSNFGF